MGSWGLICVYWMLGWAGDDACSACSGPFGGLVFYKEGHCGNKGVFMGSLEKGWVLVSKLMV